MATEARDIAGEQWADDTMRGLRAKNVWTHPHHWRYEAARDVYTGINPSLGEVAGAMVESVRDCGDVVRRLLGDDYV